MIHLQSSSAFPTSVSCPSPLTVDVPGAESHRAPALARGRRASVPKGLTMVEMLVALAFLGVFAAGIVGLAVALLNGNAKSQSTDAAVYLALDKLETIRNTAYASVTAGTTVEAYGTIKVPPVTSGQAYPDYQRTTVVSNNTPTTGVKRVVVTVLSRRGSSVSQEMIIGQ